MFLCGITGADLEYCFQTDIAIRIQDADLVSSGVENDRDGFLKQGPADKLQCPAKLLDFT
jgi:hypothetical protein